MPERQGDILSEPNTQHILEIFTKKKEQGRVRASREVRRRWKLSKSSPMVLFYIIYAAVVRSTPPELGDRSISILAI